MEEGKIITSIISNKKFDGWDVYLRKIEMFEIHLLNSHIECLRYPIEHLGYSIRVAVERNGKKQIGVSVGTEVNKNKVLRVIEKAEENANFVKPEGYVFPSISQYPPVKIYDKKLADSPEEMLVNVAERIIACDTRIRYVKNSFTKFRIYLINTFLANSEGIELEKKETLMYIELSLICKSNGKKAEYWPNFYIRSISDLNIEKRILEWSKIASSSLNAKLPETKKTTIIFPPEVLKDLLPPVIGYQSLGETYLKGLSKFEIEKQVVQEDITVIDNALYPYALNTSPFDDEGVPCHSTILIDKGIFRNRLYDQRYAILSNTKSTGNGFKVGEPELNYASPIVNTYTNIEIKPGEWDEEEILKETKEGILIKKFSWLQPDPPTGSFGAEIRNAYLIKNGEIYGAIKGGQVTGFVLDTQMGDKKISGIMRNCIAISRKQINFEDIIAPTMAFQNIQIVGK